MTLKSETGFCHTKFLNKANFIDFISIFYYQDEHAVHQKKGMF